MLRHSRDLDLTEDRFLTLTWLTPVLAHNTFHLLCMHRLAVLIRPISLGSKEDLAGVLKSKLGIDMGGSRLYQKLYPPEFDFISYPAG